MKEIILQRLADQIKHMRIERGLSQAELAKVARVGRKTVIEAEKGAPGTALGTIVAVLEAMGGELSVVAAVKPTTAELQAVLGLPSADADSQTRHLALHSLGRGLLGGTTLRLSAKGTTTEHRRSGSRVRAAPVLGKNGTPGADE